MASKFVLQVEDARESLQDLLRVCRSTNTFLSVVEYLLTIYRRVQNRPNSDLEIRRLKKTDPGFRDNVWRWSAARDFLEATGWVEVSESLILPSYVDLTKACVLLEKTLQQRGSTPSVTSSRSSTSSSIRSSPKRRVSSTSCVSSSSRLRTGDDDVFSVKRRSSTSTKGPSTSAKRPSAIPKRSSTSVKRSSTSTKRPSTSTKRPSTSSKRASAIPKRSSTSTKRSSASTRRSSTRASTGG